MPIEINEQPTVSRLVWVLNRDSEWYREDFNGRTIEVPPNHEKRLKMPFLEARRFLSRGKPMAEYTPTGVRVRGPKALYTEEIAEEIEREEKILTKSPKVFKCMVCAKNFESQKGLGLHVMRAHPDAEPGEAP